MRFLILFLMFFPMVSSFFVGFLPLHSYALKKFALVSSIVTIFVSGLVFSMYDYSTSFFQFHNSFCWFESYNIFFSFGYDGFSIYLVLLTAFILPICILSCWDYKSTFKKQIQFLFSAFLFVESCIFVIFFTTDFFIFYIFFETVLLPMFIIVGLYGSRERRIRASFLLFIYTLAGSFIILFAIFIILIELGSSNYNSVLAHCFSFEKQLFLWLAFFISFSVKIPMLPFHLWLPEAHVEAPTAGSVFLASVLLKLGTYGLVRYNLAAFSVASIFFKPFFLTLAVISVVYSSFSAMRQTDIKRVIAYASVAHINVTVAGLFSFNIEGIQGAILQMLSHGVVSGALFLCVGFLYTRGHSRLVAYYSGVVSTMPTFTIFFVFFTIGNIAFPGTSSFVGEFLIFIGVFFYNKIAMLFLSSSIIFGAVYSLWLLNRICFGNYKVQYTEFFEITAIEKMPLIFLAFFTIFLGVYPAFFLKGLHACVANLVMGFLFF